MVEGAEPAGEVAVGVRVVTAHKSDHVGDVDSGHEKGLPESQ